MLKMTKKEADARIDAAAIDVPVAQRVKELDTLTRTLRLGMNGRTMDARLAKAGVV